MLSAPTTKDGPLEKYPSVQCAVSSMQCLVCSWEARLLSNLRQLLPPARYQKQQNWEETWQLFSPRPFLSPADNCQTVSQAQKRQQTRKTVSKGTKSSQNLCQIINRRLQISCNFPNVSQMSVHVLSVLPDVISMSHVSRIIEPTAKSGSFHGQSTYHLKISREWVIHNLNGMSSFSLKWTHYFKLNIYSRHDWQKKANILINWVVCFHQNFHWSVWSLMLMYTLLSSKGYSDNSDEEWQVWWRALRNQLDEACLLLSFCHLPTPAQACLSLTLFSHRGTHSCNPWSKYYLHMENDQQISNVENEKCHFPLPWSSIPPRESMIRHQPSMI